jgi:hypothetical protein
MSLDDRQLYRLAEEIPAGKVAYYSGIQDSWCGSKEVANQPEWLEENWSGHLVVYAQGGKIRKDRGDRLPKRHGGNLVDYAAIKWLLQQPAPRYMVFDLGYTGHGTLMERASKLLQEAIRAKKIIQVPNLNELRKEINKRKR